MRVPVPFTLDEKSLQSVYAVLTEHALDRKRDLNFTVPAPTATLRIRLELAEEMAASIIGKMEEAGWLARIPETDEVRLLKVDSIRRLAGEEFVLADESPGPQTRRAAAALPRIQLAASQRLPESDDDLIKVLFERAVSVQGKMIVRGVVPLLRTMYRKAQEGSVLARLGKLLEKGELGQLDGWNTLSLALPVLPLQEPVAEKPAALPMVKETELPVVECPRPTKPPEPRAPRKPKERPLQLVRTDQLKLTVKGELWIDARWLETKLNLPNDFGDEELRRVLGRHARKIRTIAARDRLTPKRTFWHHGDLVPVLSELVVAALGL